jgi:DNA-binding transcriptional MocR family regulator
MNQFDYQRALFASELTTNARITGCVIGSHFNWKTWDYSFPSNRTIAKETGLSIRSVVRAKNELVSTGHLVSVRRFNNSNTYTPLVPVPSVLQSTTQGTSDHLKDTLKDTLKDNKDKDSKESFVMINNIIPKDVSDYLPLAEVKAMAAEDYWAVFESR